MKNEPAIIIENEGEVVFQIHQNGQIEYMKDGELVTVVGDKSLIESLETMFVEWVKMTQGVK